MKHRFNAAAVAATALHDLQDLVVTAARWTCQTGGMVRIELHVES